MTIRRRLALSFLAILVLFGLNLVIYFWGNQKRGATVADLQRAISRQILIGSINQSLNDIQKEVGLLGQVNVGAAASGVGAEEVARFNRQLEDVGKRIQELRKLSDAQAQVMVGSFEKDCRELSKSWKIFYENFGVNHTKALTELAVRGEPLSQRVLQQLLPKLQENERQEVKEAGDTFHRVARLTDQITILIFALSTVVAIVVAFRVSRYLTLKLSTLKLGAELIGSGSFNHRIPIESTDELGQLAIAYNDMADNLHSARKEMTRANVELERRHEEVEKQRQLSESLLLNILPVQVAEELRAKGAVEPKYFEDVSIVFTDFVGFTLSTEKLAAEELVHVLHDYFTAFDQIVARYHLEKLKTIGDSYMCVGGLPVGRRARRSPSHPVDAVLAAFEMVRAVTERDQPDSTVHWAVRIGVHSGPVIAGVVGIHKFAFDIWGDSVNYASRIESSGVPNRINLSERTHSRVKDFIECEYRGKVLTKEKKEMDMYFARGILPKLIDDPAQTPPPAFLRRYRAYFQKEPPAFPAFLLEPTPTSSPLV